MKKNRRLGLLSLLCWVLLALLVAAGLLFTLLTVKADRKSQGWQRVHNRSQQLIDEVQAMNVQVMADFRFGIWGENESAHVGAMLVDNQGKVLGATSGPFQAWDTCHLMVSPYERLFTEFTYTWANGNSASTGIAGRLALMTDTQGEILRTFIARNVDIPYGETLPRYLEYFPKIDQIYYGMLDDNAQSNGVHVPSQVYPLLPEQASQADTAAVRAEEEYIAWEANQSRKAGNWRLLVQPVAGGNLMITAYESDAVLQQTQLEAWEAEDWLWCLRQTALALFLVFTLATALWVFLDARGRGFKPALWGTLALAGNGIAWLVYMMVRPRRDFQNACPSCGYEPLKADFLACPLCGQILKRSCPACGHALQADWSTCPYCAKKLE